MILKKKKKKTCMMRPLQNFLVQRPTILIKYFISIFLRFHAIEAEVRLSRVFQKKQNNRAPYMIINPPTTIHILHINFCVVSFIRNKDVCYLKMSGKIVTTVLFARLCSQNLYQWYLLK